MFGHVESNIFVTCNISDEDDDDEEEEVFSVEEGNKDRRAFELESRNRTMIGRSCLNTSSLSLRTCKKRERSLYVFFVVRSGNTKSVKNKKQKRVCKYVQHD